MISARQAIHFDDSKRLRRALLDAPRASRLSAVTAGAVARQKDSKKHDEHWIQYAVFLCFVCNFTYFGHK